MADDSMGARPGTRFSEAEIKAMRRAARDEAGVLSEFWNMIKRLGRACPSPRISSRPPIAPPIRRRPRGCGC